MGLVDVLSSYRRHTFVLIIIFSSFIKVRRISGNYSILLYSVPLDLIRYNTETKKATPVCDFGFECLLENDLSDDNINNVQSYVCFQQQ